MAVLVLCLCWIYHLPARTYSCTCLSCIQSQGTTGKSHACKLPSVRNRHRAVHNSKLRKGHVLVKARPLKTACAFTVGGGGGGWNFSAAHPWTLEQNSKCTWSRYLPPRAYRRPWQAAAARAARGLHSSATSRHSCSSTLKASTLLSTADVPFRPPCTPCV